MALHRRIRQLFSVLLLAWASVAASAPSPDEHRLIQALIHRVEAMSTMRFVRNGKPHDAAEAAQHMQAKYAHFRDKIVTADDFIELCASRSEVTGKPYMVKLGDAAPVEANAFLKKELRALRDAPPP